MREKKVIMGLKRNIHAHLFRYNSGPSSLTSSSETSVVSTSKRFAVTGNSCEVHKSPQDRAKILNHEKGTHYLEMQDADG